MLVEDAKKDTSFFRRLYRIFSSTATLLVLLIVYAFLGAAIFQAIEAPHEQKYKKGVSEVLEETVQGLRQLVNRSQWNESLIREQLLDYEGQIKIAIAAGVTSPSDHEVWDFWGAMLFCATVFTTIGYGNIYPATAGGRVATMVYALFGIPLCLVVMAGLGKLFTRLLKYLWSFVRRFYYIRKFKKLRQKLNIEAGDDATFVVDDEFNLPPIIAILILVIYILIGACMYRLWEKSWTYLEAFYFIFISMSTIGFGDVIPKHPKYFLASSLYILFGLSLVAMVINVIIEVMRGTLDKAKTKMADIGHIVVGTRAAFEHMHHKAKTAKKDVKTFDPAESFSPVLNHNCEVDTERDGEQPASDVELEVLAPSQRVIVEGRQ